MYRIIHCDKDAYITNKIVRSSKTTDSRSIYANTGEASTVDIFKLYNETYLSGTLSGIELSRAFLHFDLAPLRALTGSILNFATSSFKCYMSLTNVYGGEVVPSNFTLAVHPLAKPFSEGRGFDVIGYRDLDTVNWVTASITNGIPTPWAITGSGATGSIGDSNIDYYVSGTLSIGYVPLVVTQSFPRGDENLLMDVTSLVSATLAGLLPDYGYRLSFHPTEEQDTTTRFVKRFASRHSNNLFQHPKLIVNYNDKVLDVQLDSFFDVTNSVGIYNTYFGQYRNFFSGSTPITGANSVRLDLFASHSITYWTSSFSQTHSQSINHLTTSYAYFSMSFTGSQMAVNGLFLTGAYTAPVVIDSSNLSLIGYLSGANSITFTPVWKSLDGTKLYSTGSALTVSRIMGSPSNVAERNFVLVVPNLKSVYTNQEVSRLRVFVQDYNTDVKAYYLPVDTTSMIYQNSFWRVVHKYTREVVIPFDLENNSTSLSTDGAGMYFDMYMRDLPTDQVYEFEFLIRENGQDYIIQNQGFVFKVTT